MMKTLLVIISFCRCQPCDLLQSESGSQSVTSVSTGGIDPIIRGVIGSPAPAHSPDRAMSNQVTDRLIVLNVPQHMDLAALNLQRGRDHALPG